MKFVLVISVLLFAKSTVEAATTTAPPDADVCTNPSTSKFFGEEWCKSVTETEGCRLGIVNLLFAAASGDLELLKKYKESGIDMSLTDYDGRAALHLAAAEGHLSSVEFLLKEAKVPSKPKDRWGNFPLDEAERFKWTEIVDYLKKYYAEQETTTK